MLAPASKYEVSTWLARRGDAQAPGDRGQRGKGSAEKECKRRPRDSPLKMRENLLLRDIWRKLRRGFRLARRSVMVRDPLALVSVCVGNPTVDCGRGSHKSHLAQGLELCTRPLQLPQGILYRRRQMCRTCGRRNAKGGGNMPMRVGKIIHSAWSGVRQPGDARQRGVRPIDGKIRPGLGCILAREERLFCEHVITVNPAHTRNHPRERGDGEQLLEVMNSFQEDATLVRRASVRRLAFVEFILCRHPLAGPHLKSLLFGDNFLRHADQVVVGDGLVRASLQSLSQPPEVVLCVVATLAMVLQFGDPLGQMARRLDGEQGDVQLGIYKLRLGWHSFQLYLHHAGQRHQMRIGREPGGSRGDR